MLAKGRRGASVSRAWPPCRCDHYTSPSPFAPAYRPALRDRFPTRARPNRHPQAHPPRLLLALGLVDPATRRRPCPSHNRRRSAHLPHPRPPRRVPSTLPRDALARPPLALPGLRRRSLPRARPRRTRRLGPRALARRVRRSHPSRLPVRPPTSPRLARPANRRSGQRRLAIHPARISGLCSGNHPRGAVG